MGDESKSMDKGHKRTFSPEQLCYLFSDVFHSHIVFEGRELSIQDSFEIAFNIISVTTLLRTVTIRKICANANTDRWKIQNCEFFSDFSTKNGRTFGLDLKVH